MGLWSVLFMSAMPVFRLVTHCSIGAYLSSPKSNVMPPDARQHLNKLVFICFMPSLVFSNLAQTVTVEKMFVWWFMPINVFLCYAIGAGIGICIFDYYKPPPHLKRLIIACCATGNSSNLPLVLISAICVEAGSPFGSFDICLANGIAYVSYGLWMSTVLTWTVVFNYLKPPPCEAEQAQIQGASSQGRTPARPELQEGRILPREEFPPIPARQEPQGFSGFQVPQPGGYHHHSILDGSQGFSGGTYQRDTGSFQASPGYMNSSLQQQPQDFSHGYQASRQDFQGFQTPHLAATVSQEYQHEFLGGGTGFQSSEDYSGSGFQSFQAPQRNRPGRGFDSEGTQGFTPQTFTNPGFQNYPRSSPDPQPFMGPQGFQTSQPRIPGGFQNSGFQGSSAFPGSQDRFQDRNAFPFQQQESQFQTIQFPQSTGPSSREPSPARAALPAVPGHGPETPFSLDDLMSVDKLKLLAERWRLKEAFTPPTTAAAIAIPVGAVPFFRHLLYGHEAPFRFVGDALSILGEAMVPCMNLLLGGNLSQGFGTSELGLEVVICIMLTRLVLLPMAGLVVVKLAFSMGLVPADPLFHFVLLLQFTMPTAINVG